MAVDLEKTLKAAHSKFFQTMGVNPNTGCLSQYPEKKFATYPYIGSNYGKAEKILFVGTDIGDDPKLGRIQSFSERRHSIEDKLLSKHNPHIAGTYITALYFLKNELDWDAHWDKIKNAKTCQQALRNQCNDLPLENPLAYCALTNHYKFVEEGRTTRSGSADRHYLNRDVEREFFNTEIRMYDANIIVFQGNDFLRKIASLNKTGARLYIAPHPSYRKKNGRKPEYYVNKIRLLD